MRKILLVYFYAQYPLISSISDHLYSFSRHSKGHCYYLNLAFRGVPRYLLKVNFDLIIFHTIFLATRWTKRIFKRMRKRASILKHHPAVKIALPQDEFYFSEALCDFINDLGITHVFSVAPPSEWEKIYKKVNFHEVNFHQVLTGYLEENTLDRIKRFEQDNLDRSIDIGYRAWRAEPWLGRHGMLKTQVAEVFEENAPSKGLSTDISTRYDDRLLGDDWFKFLLNCKYTIGGEGGASLLDWDGTIRQKTQNYLDEHPKASFEEVEAACFPNIDGNLRLFAISPRHLEACATKTCQILIEGNYNGILAASEHYVELKKDFSNLNQVLEIVTNETLREEMVEKAYNEIVRSGHLSYRSFVQAVLGTSLENSPEREVSSFRAILEWLIWHWTKVSEFMSWRKVSIYWKLRLAGKKMLPVLPNSLRVIVERWRQS